MFISRSIGAARGPLDDFWYGPVSSTASGALVSADTALRLSTVYKCVRVRAETIGMLPLQVYRRVPGGGKEADDSHPLASLLHDAPNPWQTAMQWRSMMQAHLDLRGNAYAQIVVAGSGRVDMLVPLHPDRVTPEIMPSGRPRYRYRQPDGSERTFVFGELLHVAGMTTDGYVGLNPIEAQREAIGAAMATRDYGAAFFRNQARPPMWIKYPGKFPTAEAKQAWSTEFSAQYGANKSGRTPVLDQGMEMHAIAINNVDAQFIDSRKMQDIDIAGLFRVPPHKLGILDRATWGNIEHQQLDFVTDAILPSCVAWEQTLLRDLEFGDGYFAEYKVGMLLRGDTKTRYEAYGKGIQDGWLLRNEARAMENLNPIDGLDVPLEPMNMQPAGSKRADQVRGVPPGADGGRAALVLAAAAERVARKECVMWRKGGPVGADHGRWLSEVLAASETAAADRIEALPAIFEASDQSMTDAEFVNARAAELLRME